MTQRIRLAITLAVRAPFVFPGDGNGALGTDTAAARDEDGVPILPGTQVQGVLREALSDLAAASNAVTKEDIADLFGAESPKNTGGLDYDTPMRGRMLVGDLTARDPLPASSVMVRVEIDDTTGAAKTGHLQMVEQVAPFGAVVRFTGEALLFWSRDADPIISAMNKAVGLIASIGAHKSAGFGEVVAAESAVVLTESTRLVPPVARETDCRIGLAACFDRPILVNADRVADNAFRGAPIVPGAVFKGALAERLRLAGGSVADHAAALSAMTISHAFPEGRDGTGRAAEALPLSWVAVKTDKYYFGDALRLDKGDDLADIKGPMLAGKPALFQSDWKDGWADAARENAGWPARQWATQIPRTHTMIGDGGVAEDQNLFTTIALSTRRPWEPQAVRRFLLTIDLSAVPKPEMARASALVALLKGGLDGIGRTGASVTFTDHPEAAALPAVTPVHTDPELFAVVLTTDAVLTDPSQHEQTAATAYRTYWKDTADAQLVDFIASQRLAGGYLATRYRPWGRAYHPFIVTEAGSVFLLRGATATKLSELARSGLPLPAFAGVSALTWENCPFVPGNGYGAFRADHLAKETEMQWSRAVTHV